MKTILSAFKVWVESKIKDNKKQLDKRIDGSVADWSQNDSAADNYVKNRTHWEETVEKELLVPVTVEIDISNQPYVNAQIMPFIENQTYVVTWNGEEYSCTAYATSGGGIAIGNGKLFVFGDNGGNGNGEPFFYISYEDEFAALFPAESGTYTISITTSETVVHKLDPKYLPKLASTPDWNQNDPKGEGYIENRPFYTELRRSIFVEEVEVTYPEDLYTEYEPSSVVLGDTYIIVVDGVEYEGIMTSDGGFPYLNPSDNSCPVYWYDGAFSFSIFDIQDGERFIVKIIHVESDITAIPEKYIPDTIARASYFMSNNNPAGSGSFSMNRKPGTTIGSYSHAEGYNTIASGDYSHAEGAGTTASSSYSHAEGLNTVASKFGCHAEGNGTTASGLFSHAEGNMTIASGSYSHAEGTGTQAIGSSSHAEGKFNISDTTNTHAHIVGNGESDTKRSNAHTLDWEGNAWYQGDVYVGSTSGTNKDEGSKKLATEEYVDAALENIQLPDVQGELITVEDIDEICGASILAASEVTF